MARQLILRALSACSGQRLTEACSSTAPGRTVRGERGVMEAGRGARRRRSVRTRRWDREISMIFRGGESAQAHAHRPRAARLGRRASLREPDQGCRPPRG